MNKKEFFETIKNIETYNQLIRFMRYLDINKEDYNKIIEEIEK